MPDFNNIVIEFLRENNNKISEHLLLKHLETHHSDFFSVLPNPDRLYEKHFYLFHKLYQLKQALFDDKLHLTVSALTIELLPTTSSHEQAANKSLGDNHPIGDSDPLAEFYLDKNNLYLSESEVHAMQKKFWQRYLAIQQKSDAIICLELQGETPLTLQKVKKQYQKLAQQHHPDKGGDAEKFQAIKQAFNELKLIF